MGEKGKSPQAEPEPIVYVCYMRGVKDQGTANQTFEDVKGEGSSIGEAYAKAENQLSAGYRVLYDTIEVKNTIEQ